MSQRITRVVPMSAAKLFGAMYFVIGIVAAPFLAIPALMAGGDQGSATGIGLLLILPVIYGVMGFVGMAIFAWFYNVLAARIGGIEIETDAVG